MELYSACNELLSASWIDILRCVGNLPLFYSPFSQGQLTFELAETTIILPLTAVTVLVGTSGGDHLIKSIFPIGSVTTGSFTLGEVIHSSDTSSYNLRVLLV